MMYVETQADAAFTLWLATRDARKVEAERHAHLTRPEQRMVSAAKLRMPKPPRPPKPPKPEKQQFTRTQIAVALRALQAGEESK